VHAISIGHGSRVQTRPLGCQLVAHYGDSVRVARGGRVRGEFDGAREAGWHDGKRGEDWGVLFSVPRSTVRCSPPCATRRRKISMLVAELGKLQWNDCRDKISRCIINFDRSDGAACRSPAAVQPSTTQSAGFDWKYRYFHCKTVSHSDQRVTAEALLACSATSMIWIAFQTTGCFSRCPVRLHIHELHFSVVCRTWR